MRCSLCPGTHRMVLPDGPTDARIMLIGEGPGWQEDQRGIPFVGVSGQELKQTYFRLAGISPEEVYISNVLLCRCEKNGVDTKPGAGLLQTCAANHLPDEIWTVNPEIIILCGTTPCSLVPGIDLEYEHGFPRRVEDCEGLGGWSGTVIPMYHPAAGMHQTALMTPMLEDWARIRHQREEIRNTEDASKVDYRLVETGRELSAYFNTPGPVSIDTETDRGKPYSVQCSLEAGTAVMVLTENSAAMHTLRHLLLPRSAVMHNASFDLGVCQSLGIEFQSYRDTMQEIYALGNLPQGLKKAIYRIFGYRMTSYEDVVIPHSKLALHTWLAEALGYVSGDLRTRIEHPIGPACPTCGKKHRKDVSVSKPHEAEAVLRRVLEKGVDGDYDPWELPTWSKGREKVRLIGRSWMGIVEMTIGPMPQASIVHAPMEEQIRYACSDADWTGRLAGWLRDERERIVREEWRVSL